ncbi:MAG: family 78 glycoside hydrolase catalytic domain [Clostridia bacterium]|nr:family 78 glycoside hydrolase catalytic domain [Clostridia bacterium]
MNKHFICATRECNSYQKHIPAPYLRRSFVLASTPQKAELSICGLGFYVLYVNGKDITKGLLAPYMSAPDDYCYYDTYDVAPYLQEGENVIGVLLGNGYMNPFGGEVWDFQYSPWLGSPRMALDFCAETDGGEVRFVADEQFRTHPSPILFDEMRSGEIYDATRELAGWNMPGFDDGDWQAAIPVEAPRGELRRCTAEPIRSFEEKHAIKIWRDGDAYIYDFGINTAGFCRLSLRGTRGQTVTMRHFEMLRDGKLQERNIIFPPEKYPRYKEFAQKAVYTAKGEDVEEWAPVFTYSGFRYVQVEGISAQQATESLLTMCVCHSDLERRGGFSCSDERANTLFSMAVNSDLSNFYYFPTDCPHREKHGWTGDASMSSDHMVLLYGVEKSYREWLANIRKSQNDVGALPGIIPTGGWGFAWGNGPVFDSVIFNLPYALYRFRGDTDAVRENAHAMVRYLEYIMTQRSADGTVEIGLGDWVPVGRAAHEYTIPLGLCNCMMVMDVAGKAAEMFRAIGLAHQAKFAAGIRRDMRQTIRRVYLDRETCTLVPNSQSGQAMGLYYGVFENEEREAAFASLMECIRANGNNFDSGFVGMHCIFHVLSDFGQAELAWQMITKSEYPSYGHLIERGETSIPEKFQPDGDEQYRFSHNHHFLCDFTRWFMFAVAGLKVIDHKTVELRPNFISTLDHAEAYHELPAGRVSVHWQRTEEGLFVEAEIPYGVVCKTDLPDGVRYRVRRFKGRQV